MVAERVLALLGALAIAAAAGAAGGWAARGWKAERDAWKTEADQLRGDQILAAGDRRTAAEASAGYQAETAAIRAAMAQLAIEANHALRTPIRCAAGVSAVELGDVPIPAASVDRLRRAAGELPPD